MKKAILFFVVSILFSCIGLYAQTNDFYDDSETITFKMPEIEILGEISNPGKIDLSNLPLRTVIVKETVIEAGKDKFIGAYRYDGYSLYDLLNKAVLAKKNEVEFPPIIDLYVEIESETGEKVVVSWGEIYYPIHQHEILIANRVARIVPSKTKELWPLPTECKLIIASDLYTHRNISNPKIIRVKSYVGKYQIVKGMSPMYTKSFSVKEMNGTTSEIEKIGDKFNLVTFPAVFYGRGRGIHGTTPFTGIMLKDFLKEYIKITPDILKSGLIVMAGKDGYHAVFTISEVMNRNDQAEFLLLHDPNNMDGGAFQIFPASDFFSDRAIKSLESIRIE